MDWYSFRGIFKTEIVDKEGNLRDISLVEQRIVLLRAESFDEAIRLGEIEAESYARDTWPNAEGELVKTRYMGACDVFSVNALPAEGVEVYSSVLVLRAPERDEMVVERLLGSEVEQASDGDFEPDFDRLVEVNRKDAEG
jgi:hypothetical protein